MSGGFGSGVKLGLYNANKVANYQHAGFHQSVCTPPILELVPKTAKRILDIGCCMGGAGRTLKQRQACEVWGVEISPELARIAAQHYEKVIVGDIEDDSVWQQLPKGYFDCVICGEVLEHLLAPDRVLKRLHEVTVPDCTLVLSVPHVGHASVIRKILRGDFDYEPTGILDESHLRFFSRKNLWRLLLESGWLVTHSIAGIVPNELPDDLKDALLGMVGPCSNFASGQQIEVNYRNLKEMHEFAAKWCAQHFGTGWETAALIGFCVLMRRSLIDAIGGLDTRFGLGMHEDIDHSLRARVAGFRCWLALDAFVHHYGNRTSGRLGVEKMMDAAFPRFKEKWNLPEEAEKYRPRIMLVPELFDPRRRPPQPKDLYEPLPDPSTLTVLDGRKFKPLISLCMIVKDEAENLPRCLESVKGIVDEIIVVDTGSTDETPQIAERYGAKVIHFEWTGSFSDARNESLRHAKGEWILWLDADEALAEGKERLRVLLEENDGIRPSSHAPCPAYDGFILPMVSFVGMRSHREGHVHPAFRLFRNLPGISFERNLHEQIASSIKKVKPDAKFGVLPVWIEHYGYLSPLVRRKQKVARNLELAKKDLRANPFDPFAWYNLGREYMRLSQWERAFYCFRRALFHLGDNFTPYLMRCLCDAVECLMRLNRHQQALAFLKEAQQLPITTPDLWMLEGKVRFVIGDWSGALKAFQRALQFPQQLPTDFDWTEGATSYGAWHWMGLCFQKMGQLGEALRCFGIAIQQALVRRRYYEPAISSFVALALPQCRSPMDLERLLEPFVPNGFSAHPPLALLVAKAALSQFPLPSSAIPIAEQLIEVTGERGGNGNVLKVDPIERQFVQAKLALLQHRYSEAAKIFAQVPLTAPEGAAAWNLRILAHALAGEWEEAFNVCGEDALWQWLLRRWQGLTTTTNGNGLDLPTALLPSLRENFRELLALLLQLQEFERYEQALDLLNWLVSNEKERAEFLGSLYGQFGFWDMVLETLLPLAQDGGMSRESWRLLAKACQHKGFYDEAAAILLRLIESDERKDEALADYMALAGCYIAAGDSQRAEAVLALAQQLAT
jgi:glycosyltransferase involved in cell wall biosynthesis/2-polyprenyl-3-methyl-5-hydroxy-6-metoxy-1,4-benzoquinol methylase/Flp pilus assembly protein TadD